MKGYALHYMINFLIFAFMTIITFVLDVETPAIGCPEETAAADAAAAAAATAAARLLSDTIDERFLQDEAAAEPVEPACGSTICLMLSLA